MSQLVVEGCDPRERAGQILDLFARNGQSRFAAAFDRAYRPRAERGLRSWVGLLDNDAVMHVSVSPIPFRDGGRTLTAGIMGDLLVAGDQRDFWAPLRLLRTVVADLKRSGGVDFLITTTTPDAESVFRGAGFKTYGQLRRFVLPLHAPYLALARVRARARRLVPTETTEPTHLGESSLRSSGLWRPIATSDYYGTRFGREEFMDGTWIAAGPKGEEPIGHVLLCRHAAEPAEIELADAFWSEPQSRLSEIALTGARWARRRGLRKLVTTALAESRACGELLRAGFLARAVRSQLLVQPLREAPPVEDVFLSGLPLSSW